MMPSLPSILFITELLVGSWRTWQERQRTGQRGRGACLAVIRFNNIAGGVACICDVMQFFNSNRRVLDVLRNGPCSRFLLQVVLRNAHESCNDPSWPLK